MLSGIASERGSLANSSVIRPWFVLLCPHPERRPATPEAARLGCSGGGGQEARVGDVAAFGKTVLLSVADSRSMGLVCISCCPVLPFLRLQHIRGNWLRVRRVLKKFIARQPIFTAGQDVLGYEILFRAGPENYFTGDSAGVSASAVDNVLLFGIDRVTSGRLAFLNCPRDFLLRDYLTFLPPDRVVGEILETVSPDQETLEACRRLKRSGYRLALDDFVETPEMAPFVEIADYVKIDFLATNPSEQEQLAREFRQRGVQLIAEKVETHEDFRRGIEMGYQFFQGYFFCRPQMAERREIPARKLNYLRILQMANKPALDREELSEAIKRETSLTYRLLRYLNSPTFALRANVDSIPKALNLLGDDGIRRWVSLVSVAAMGEDKPNELIMVPLLRARFCELLAPVTGLIHKAGNLFFMGLLSVMDAIMDMPLSTVLADIPVQDEIKGALLGQAGQLRDVLEIAINYETGTWEQLVEVTKRARVDEELVPDLFDQSLDWAKGVMNIA
jgi:c-di-GMP-related signal transduction protein